MTAAKTGSRKMVEIVGGLSLLWAQCQDLLVRGKRTEMQTVALRRALQLYKEGRLGAVLSLKDVAVDAADIMAVLSGELKDSPLLSPEVKAQLAYQKMECISDLYWGPYGIGLDSSLHEEVRELFDAMGLPRDGRGLKMRLPRYMLSEEFAAYCALPVPKDVAEYQSRFDSSWPGTVQTCGDLLGSRFGDAINLLPPPLPLWAREACRYDFELMRLYREAKSQTQSSV